MEETIEALGCDTYMLAVALMAIPSMADRINARAAEIKENGEYA